VEWKYGYLFAWLIMISVAGGLFAYFRRKQLI